MTPVEICFWAAAACVLYPYLIYPLLAGALARLRGRPVRAAGPPPRSVSVVVAAHNEEGAIVRRIDEMTTLLDAAALEGEVIVVSDGSVDNTAAAARAYPDRRVRVLELSDRSGKAAALSKGCAVAVHEILVFADVRQTWAADALPRMLANFADPEVGAVSGDLIVRDADGALAGVGLYWRFEKWLRRQESRLWSGVGATGAVSAVRRELFRPIPPGTILDDVYWPMEVALDGYRVVHDEQAHAFDRLPERTRDEFRRKVRTLSGCLQLARRLPTVLLPWRNPVWLQFVSHKLLRLLAPWGLLALLVASLLAPGPFYRAAFVCQAVCYVAAGLGLWTSASRFRPFAAAASFLVLNAAAWAAFWVWITGRTERSWVKATYRVAAPRATRRSPFGRDAEGSAGEKRSLPRPGRARAPSPSEGTTMPLDPLLIASAGLPLAAVSGLGLAYWQARRRFMGRWLISYLKEIPKRRPPRRGQDVHLLLCVADHYEPKQNRPSAEVSRGRVERWVRDYPRQFGRFRDADGRTPRHSFFFPVEEYEPEYLDALADLCRSGFGEVEIHLHHDRDNADHLRATLRGFKELLARRHGLLSRRRGDGELAYGFIHGNWSLCNSRPDGRWCGVNDELDVSARDRLLRRLHPAFRAPPHTD